MAIDPELVHAGSEEDEDPEVLLLSRSHRTKGHAVVMTETLSGEVTERQTTGGDSLSALVPTKAVPSSSLQLIQSTSNRAPQWRFQSKVSLLGLSRLNFPLQEFYLLLCHSHLRARSSLTREMTMFTETMCTLLLIPTNILIWLKRRRALRRLQRVHPV